MSPTPRRRKTARKATKAKRPAPQRKKAAKRATKKVARKAATRKTAQKTTRKTTRKTAKKAATKRTARAAGKRTARKSSRSTAPRRQSAVKSARRAASPAAKRSTTRKPAARAVAPKTAGARRRPVKPEVARRHFLEILEAKRERVKQGPGYPPPNAFTGRPHDAAGAVGIPPPPNGPAPATSPATPDAQASTFKHGRGNQGMRGQS